MITVKNLTKVYTDHDKKSLTALKNISFKLPDKGLVFITGKSGSGKSTLLNLLGGLDNITKGDIIADGNRFSKFTPLDYDKYRNSYIGFIFQDYCLLDDLTVYENIELGMNLNAQEEKSIIHHILDKVHLKNCENRYPRELSGGQKQRVAIARALAKNPELFLADEPTGNLDSKTAKAIMKILKDLSATKLVIVVSHNLEDAETYGDRIIELADGEIIRDEEKMQGYEDKLELINGKLILPHAKELTPDDLKTINKLQKQNQIYEFDKRQDGFYPANNDITSQKIVITEKSKLSFSQSLKLAWTFLKRRKLSFIITSLIITCIMSILGICQFFVKFDYKTAINEAVASENITLLTGYKSEYVDKDYDILNTTFIYPINSDDISAFDNTDYDKEYFKLYNNAIHIAGASQLLRQEIQLFAQTNLANFYALESYGTLTCNLNYLKNTFANGNDCTFYGNPTDKPYGIIITDYIADALLYQHPEKYTSYTDILGRFYETNSTYSHYINAIIDTGYKDKFESLKTEIMHEYESKVSLGKTSQIYETARFESFAHTVESSLGIAYSLNADYINAIQNIESKNFTRLDYSYVSTSNEDISYIDSLVAYNSTDNDYFNIILNENEIALSTKAYNKLFNTNYNSTNIHEYITPTTITLSKYYRTNSIDDTPLITKELKIVTLIGSDNYISLLNEKTLLEFRKFDTFNYALFFDDIDNVGSLYSATKDRAFSINSEAFMSVCTMAEIVDIFNGFFTVINIGLLLACLLLLINFGAGNIRKRKFEIGVIKAMGGRTSEVGKIFIIQLIGVGLIVCVLSTISLLALSGIVNSILTNAMFFFLKSTTLKNTTIIQFNLLVLVLDILMILGITILSAMLALRKLHKIKPINIIKHKN